MAGFDRPIIVERGEDRYDNEAQARAVIHEYDACKDKPDAVLVKCLTREEAMEIKACVARLRPEITVSVSWITFYGA